MTATAARRPPQRSAPSGRALQPPPATASRVALGVTLALALPAALVLGPVTVAVVMALLAGAASLETGVVRRRSGTAVVPALAGVTGAALPVAAVVSAGVLGAVIVAGVGVTVAAAAHLTGRSGPDTLASGGTAVAAWLLPGGAGAGVVLALDVEPGSVVALLVLAIVYDLGLLLVGAGATTRWEGPVAGAVGVAVAAFAVAVVPIPPFDPTSILAFGALALVAIPAGPPAATLLLGAADADAPALRRLDSLLVVAPLWAWTVGLHVGLGGA